MYNKTLPYLSLSALKECVPKTALNLSRLNKLSLPLCEILVKNATNTDSIFYAITDIKNVQRIVRKSNNYQNILGSTNTINKKNLIKSLVNPETLCTLGFDESESEVVEILANDLCN